jgi:L-rhamnose mutarotase
MGYRAYIGRIREGKQQDYIEAHKTVWPELIDAMKEAGVSKESCFVLNNHIFVYVEAPDIGATIEKLANDPVNQRWDTLMESMLERPTTDSLELFPEMTEVFRMQDS